MISKYLAISTVFILIIFLTTFRAFAQPTLPDITGSVEKGRVVLTWNCQYNGVRAISVMRSRNSINDFEIIGYVKKTDKGVQSFVDAFPATGKNFYKLAIVFNTGLTWRSNHYGVNVAKPNTGPEQPLPSNDSLSEPVADKETPLKEKKTAKFEKEPDNTIVKNTDNSKLKPVPDTCKKLANPGVSISFASDTSKAADNKKSEHHPRFTLTFDTTKDNTPIFIKSRFINTDSATGHVNMFLPDDVSMHHYSVKFYDKDKHVIIDIPRINTSKIIIDKRNFQRKGIYKFILRRDVVELESGYILLN